MGWIEATHETDGHIARPFQLCQSIAIEDSNKKGGLETSPPILATAMSYSVMGH